MGTSASHGLNILIHNVQNMMFPMRGFFSKYGQIHSFLPIWSHILKKSLMENFIFCAVSTPTRENTGKEKYSDLLYAPIVNPFKVIETIRS